jgi:hypothetical protein
MVGWGKGGEMTQTLYANMNLKNEKKRQWPLKTGGGSHAYHGQNRLQTYIDQRR